MTNSTRVGGGRYRARLGILALSTILSSGLAVPAVAQLAPPPPVRQSIDANGVDLFSGKFNAATPALTLGQEDQGLAYRRMNSGSGWYDNIVATLNESGGVITVSFAGVSDRFTVSGTVFTPTEGNGATLSYNGTSLVYTYRRADGTVILFDRNRGSFGPYYANRGRATSITLPSGAKLSYTYDSIYFCTAMNSSGLVCISHAYEYRVARVRNSYGYALDFSYAEIDPHDPTDASMQPDFTTWGTITAVTGDNLASSGGSAPSHSYGVTSSGGSTYDTVTDTMNRVTSYKRGGFGIAGIKRPGSSAEDVTIAYTSGRVSGVTSAAGTTSYSVSDSGNVRTVTVTDPASHATVYTFDIAKQRMTSMTDALGNTTEWTLDSYGRVTRITYPEDNYTAFTYDSRGNVTEQRQVAKPGSGLADIVTSAAYPSTCANPVTCNQPESTTDARGNTTDYTYDSTHGGVLTVTAPEPTSGATRPQVRYGYTSLQAYFDTGSGIVASGEPVYRLTSVSQCQTGSSCTGTADEVKTSIDYGPQTSGTGNNLLVASTSSGAGDGSLTATATTGYDDVGNAITVDGPLPGSADTTRYRYNAARELVGVTSPDPDGAGSLKPRATRLTRDAKGRVMLAELGNVDSQSDTDWAGFTAAQAVETAYDGVDRKLTGTLKNGSTAHALTQYSYNSAGLLECTAVRMNASQWGSLPSDACTLQSAGSDGPDRVTRTTYDAANRPTLVETGYGTGDAADEVTTTYNANNTVASVIDGNGNKTSYEYDGHDRLVKTFYPSPTLGAGTSSTTDYEQLAYDAGGNVTIRYLRGYPSDGTRYIAYAYDALGRLTYKDRQGGETDVAYSYDNLGRLTQAIDSASNYTGFAYDALSRVTAQSSPLGVTGTGYDLAGRRTLLVHENGGFYVNYDRLVTGELSAVRQEGATSGAGVLATYAYDQLGRRTGVTRGNGTSTSTTFDAVSLLASLSHDLASTASDVSATFSYNKASQIASVTRDNDAYAFGHANAAKAYTVNGLNQATAAAGVSLTYDARGNTATIGGASYGYSSENLLVTAPGSVTLDYDPLNRLYTTSAGMRFRYDGADLIGEYDSSGVLQKRYVHGDGTDEPLVEYTRNGSGTYDRNWLHADERGSIVAHSDGSGAKTAINAYDEYGVPGSGNTGRFQYTGQAWLPEIGMYYYKARIYAPELGRFMQTDPLGYADGLNWYNYVGSDPVNAVDPSGTDIVVNGRLCRGICIRDPDAIRAMLDMLRLQFSLPACTDDLWEGCEIVVTGTRPQPKRDKKNSGWEKFGQCTLDQFGITGLLDAGAAALGIPQEGSKRFVTPGSSRGTSALSEGLARRFPQRVGDTGIGRFLGIKRIWTPRIGQLNRATPVIGRAAGRLIPVVGAILLIKDAVQIAGCTMSK